LEPPADAVDRSADAVDGPADALATLPDSWRETARATLSPDEHCVGWFDPNLDERLVFHDAFLLLTSRRLLAFSPGKPQSGASSAAKESSLSEWPLGPEWSLEADEYGAAGTLELVDRQGRKVQWRYTAGRAVAAHRFAQQFAATRDAGGATDTTGTVCPSCGAVLPPASGPCPTCAPAPTTQKVSSLFRLTRFARPHLPAILLGFFLTLAGTAANLIPPYLTIPLLDKVLIPYQEGTAAVDFSIVKWYLAGLFGASMAAWLINWAKTYVLAWVSERVSTGLRTKTYAHLQTLSLEFFGGKRTGDLMSRIGSDTDRICNFLSLNLVEFANDLIMIAMTSAILLSIDYQLALATLLPLPPIIWLVHWVRARLRRGFRRAATAWGHMTSVLADTIPGIRVVKAFAQEKREVERFGRANQRVLDANDRVNVLWAFFGPFVLMLTDLGLLVVWGFGVWRIWHGSITVGMMTAFLAYIARFYGRIESLIFMVSATQRAAAASQRLFEILDRRPSVADPVRPMKIEVPKGKIELRHVSFKYGARQVLSDVNLTIEAGEMIGLVGPSGAGKSTLINLVCRFYDVAEGAILLDGVDIRSLKLEDYRRQIGIVLQDPFLFYGTIAENIAYGRPEATREEIVAAARAARAHEFILRLADGYESLVGERGQSLSGGERQRISIARALLIQPKILILDEATSSVDTETEREIQAALENLIEGRTTIAIAHRLSTLRRANRLVVLDGGHIVDVGKHEELVNRTGTYSRLHKAQLQLAQQAI
jgi:ATP-binding cassette, subfamily B, bacterial